MCFNHNFFHRRHRCLLLWLLGSSSVCVSFCRFWVELWCRSCSVTITHRNYILLHSRFKLNLTFFQFQSLDSHSKNSYLLDAIGQSQPRLARSNSSAEWEWKRNKRKYKAFCQMLFVTHLTTMDNVHTSLVVIASSKCTSIASLAVINNARQLDRVEKRNRDIYWVKVRKSQRKQYTHSINSVHFSTAFFSQLLFNRFFLLSFVVQLFISFVWLSRSPNANQNRHNNPKKQITNGNN